MKQYTPGKMPSEYYKTGQKPRLNVEISRELKSALTELVPRNYLRPIYTAFTEILVTEMRKDKTAIIYKILNMDIGMSSFITDPIEWLQILLDEFNRACDDLGNSTPSLKDFVEWLEKRKFIKVKI